MTGHKLPPGVSVDAIDQVLPQTQCTQCGYEGCRPYAEALAAGESEIDRCPPGGPNGVVALARLLQRPELPLDTTRGTFGPLEVAVIEEEHCIGCTLCIQACPVDAIVGANLRMHTVVADDCTGCQLCIAPCPVDCITMVPVLPVRWWQPADARAARLRYERRNERLQWLEEVARGRRQLLRTQAQSDVGPSDDSSESSGLGSAGHPSPSTTETANAGPVLAGDQLPASAEAVAAQADAVKKAAVAAALARARARRSGS